MPIKTIIEPLRIKSIEAIRQRHQIHFRVFAEYQRSDLHGANLGPAETVAS
jgi:hypothetical protein